MRTLLLVISLLIGIENQSQTFRCELYEAYKNHQMDRWKKAILAAEAKLTPSSTESDVFEVTLAMYGYTGYLTGQKRHAEAKVYLAKLKNYTTRLENSGYKPSRVLAMKAAAKAYKLSMNRALAVTEGPGLLRLINKAHSSDPQCAYALVEKGNASYYTPAAWGGSYSDAVKNYQKAKAALEKDPAGLECDWYYLFTLTMLSQAYLKSGMVNEYQNLKKKMPFLPEMTDQ